MAEYYGNTRRALILQKLRSIMTEYMKEVYTCIPAHIKTFDPNTQLAQIELGIKRVDVNGETFTPPPIIQTPVLFVGDKWSVETQIDTGCEGLALFSQRCIDAWVQAGGVAENPLRRFFDIQDAFFIPGFRPMPSVLKGFQNNGARLRNADGSHYVWLKNDGTIEASNGDGSVNIASSGAITLSNGSGSIQLLADGSVNINGLVITPNGTLTDSGGISLNTHTHSGVESGPNNTGVPNAS